MTLSIIQANTLCTLLLLCTIIQANTWIDLADGQSHKIVIRRNQDKIFLKVDDGPEHYSRLAGKTDKFMLPMKVQIGKNFKGCISSFDIITKNSKGLLISPVFIRSPKIGKVC